MNIEPFTGAAQTPGADIEFPPHVLGDGKELILMRSEMKRARSYLEFGTGGSTLLAMNLGLTRIITVDSDAAWRDRIRQRAHIVRPRNDAEFIHSNIGKTGEWGSPVDEKAIRMWPLYYVVPWQRCLERYGLPDLVFVDGRFRLSCALYSVLMYHAHASWFGRRLRIMFHDFNREHYHPIKQYADVIAIENTLAVLKPKARQPIGPILCGLMHSQFDFR